MKTDLETIKLSFEYGFDEYEASRIEAERVEDFYHNRQWSDQLKAVLNSRGQPVETFNVIKMFSRMLIGYYSTVLNQVRAEPRRVSDQSVSSLLTDVISSVFEQNNMEVVGDQIKLAAILSGVMCCQVEPIFTGQRDEFGRKIYKIKLAHVPHNEIVLDPMAREEDYSDGRFLHRFKWVTADVIKANFGEKILDSLEPNYAQMGVEEAPVGPHGFKYRTFDNYLLIHTVVEDDEGKRWSILWCGDTEISREEITYRDVRWMYRVVKLHPSNQTEYYGIFREVIESQLAINQAIVKLQLMVNTQKIFVTKNAVDNIEEFTSAVNRVNGVIQVKDLAGIKIENLSSEAQQQYVIIDAALNRIQRMLSINDSFLGMAFASDSGRKVKLQQNATIMALRYLTVRLESFYKLVGTDIAKLVRQYYTATQAMAVTDEIVGRRYFELNAPMQVWSGELDEAGQPVYTTVLSPVNDPDTGMPMEDEDGNLVFAPVPEDGTDIDFDEMDIIVNSVAYNDEDERAQLMLETVMSGNVGQALAQINPAGFFMTAGLVLRTMKTKYSPEISKILEDTAMQLAQSPEQVALAQMMFSQNLRGLQGSQGDGMSQELKLPANTNEVM